MPSIDDLLTQVPDSPDEVLKQLHEAPELASRQDAHGYSLLHAAVSYDHADLVNALIKDYHVDINLRDEDGETALFNAESVDMAKQLLTLGIDFSATNSEGQTAADKLDDEDEQPLVAAYLKNPDETATSTPEPLRLPSGMQINVGVMDVNSAGEADPTFRQRINDLAAREDFQSPAGQQELRNLVSEAVAGIGGEVTTSSKRRKEG
ncbi:ankyrin repeat protein [Piedraia hortae CBS 480.64]|uniref:Ankyrin repeat protein n=1 Tax=Piedraia hortae CBS 480.64 TaxID=1314780 RepID=A0A6A7C627_9PEZI|nr:ankyrin repeat protein [Piedraia hortae CBS 480.64]